MLFSGIKKSKVQIIRRVEAKPEVLAVGQMVNKSLLRDMILEITGEAAVMTTEGAITGETIEVKTKLCIQQRTIISKIKDNNISLVRQVIMDQCRIEIVEPELEAEAMTLAVEADSAKL